MQKEWKKQKKSFATLEAQLEEEANASDITDSDDEEETSHFQHHTLITQRIHNTMLDKDICMRNVILLDNESTMDLFCNRQLITGVHNSKDSVKVKSNGGTLMVKQKATLDGYHSKVWFKKRAVTNILALANVTKQYRVTYDSGNDKGFVVHRSEFGLPDMRFQLHRSGLHIYDPKMEQLTFVNTVEQNMQAFTKRQIASAHEAKSLYAKLAYPSIKDFEWTVISNQIQDCPITKNDIENAQAIWGKDVAALKGKTVRSHAPAVKGVTLKVPYQY